MHGTEPQLASLWNDTYQTEFVNVAELIDRTHGLEPLFGPLIKDLMGSLHGFTHSGLEQLRRRSSQTDIMANFSGDDIRYLINNTTMFAFITVLGVSAFLDAAAEHKIADEMFREYLLS